MSFTFLVSQSSPVLLTSYFPLFPPGFLGKRFRLKSKEQFSLNGVDAQCCTLDRKTFGCANLEVPAS